MKDSIDSKPLVSIVMPIYGVEKYIANSVKSVICQTYDNIELILVDSGSPDKSVEIAEQVLKENRYPYRLIRQKHLSQGEARNTGFRQAKGKWIMFLDSDDMILPETTNVLVKTVEKNQADLVFSSYRMIYSADEICDDNKPINAEVIEGKALQDLFLLRKRVVLVVGTLFKRELMSEKEMFFEKIPWSEDQHFVWKYLSFTENAVFVDKAYYQYLQRPGSIMNSSGIDNMIQSYPAICELSVYYDKDTMVGRYLVSRWVMGTLNSAGRIAVFEDWQNLFVALDSKQHLKNLLRFPSLRVRLFSMIGLISKRLYYRVLSKY